MFSNDMLDTHTGIPVERFLMVKAERYPVPLPPSSGAGGGKIMTP